MSGKVMKPTRDEEKEKIEVKGKVRVKEELEEGNPILAVACRCENRMKKKLKVKVEEPEESNAILAVALQDENGTATTEEALEEALVALIHQRRSEVEHLRRCISYYETQLDQAQESLTDAQSRLDHLRCHDSVLQSMNSQVDYIEYVKFEQGLNSVIPLVEDSPKNQPQSRPKLLIPAADPGASQPSYSADGILKVKGDQSSNWENIEAHSIEKKREFAASFQSGNKELIPLICSSPFPHSIKCRRSNYIAGQHKRKLRSLVLCPTNNEQFVTSALDGVVNLWKIQDRGSSAHLLNSFGCVSPKKRRWPEDIAWHPEGNCLFSVYSADDGDSQISVVNLNKRKKGNRVYFLKENPHEKGVINNIKFMPWDDACFVTGGSDHAVILWKEKDSENSWKPKTLHRSLHSSAVMGLAGMQQKQIILSAGADKRILGFDLSAGTEDYKHQLESKCMSVLPNPHDFHLFMVQTGTPEKQLRLFDIRDGQREIHAFGWKQDSSESQSALISQAWSPNGLCISSGSADPVIHFFDIRYNACKPFHSLQAHQKRVFKAAWHHSLPILVSISSDLNIGFHKVK